MKTKITWTILLLVITTLAFASEKEQGNGTMRTQTFYVNQYSKLYLGENIEYNGKNGTKIFKKRKDHFPTFYYTQTNGNAVLVITIDENLMDLLTVDQQEETIYIRAKKGIRINPTKLIINGKSKQLTYVDIIGCMHFVSETPLDVEKLKFNIYGVGDITLDQLSGKELSFDLMGVGNIYLTGKLARGNYQLSGVGKVKAYDCQVEDLTCDVSGVGSMEVFATEKLRASTSGVGSISYKGEAIADTSSSGIGRIKKAKK
ncbi:DUF2807 domain-containing protein [Parabacteroides sp. OttesenSCG-928-K15]|nr:DUF2807 domain-containing protein [Parabacteroides sp. OttesenSCG-928-K15]